MFGDILFALSLITVIEYILFVEIINYLDDFIFIVEWGFVIWKKKKKESGEGGVWTEKQK